jgi:hypothetical protein
MAASTNLIPNPWSFGKAVLPIRKTKKTGDIAYHDPLSSVFGSWGLTQKQHRGTIRWLGD